MTNVLVVDDSQIMRKKAIDILQKQNFVTFEAHNGKQALSMIDEVNPDIILLDVIMPEMGGYEILKILKGDQKYEHIPVIMITVKAEKDDIVEGLNMGADDYVTKPFDPMELLARINACIRVKDLRDKLVEQHSLLSDANKTIAEQEKIAIIGQFMVGVHHELRNPLAAAMSYSQILLKYFNVEEEQRFYLSDIEEQLQAMKLILNNIKEMDSITLEEYVDGVTMVKLSGNKG